MCFNNINDMMNNIFLFYMYMYNILLTAIKYKLSQIIKQYFCLVLLLFVVLHEITMK